MRFALTELERLERVGKEIIEEFKREKEFKLQNPEPDPIINAIMELE